MLRCSAFGGVLYNISCILRSDNQPSAECCILFRVFAAQIISLRRSVAYYFVYSHFADCCAPVTLYYVLYIQNYFSGKLWVLCHLFICPAYFEYFVYYSKSILFAYSLYAVVTCRHFHLPHYRVFWYYFTVVHYETEIKGNHSNQFHRENSWSPRGVKTVKTHLYA
jgi:hypothetical protein